jgi:Na+/H+-dicarboxylate symporter
MSNRFMPNRFTLFILLAMVLGLVVGYLCFSNLPVSSDVAGALTRQSIADYFQLGADVFLRLIKMIIAPLVMSTLIVGIAHMGSGSSLGRVGLRTLLWFLGASIVSLALGAVLATLLQPGVNSGLQLSTTPTETGIVAGAVNLKDFITQLIPKSIGEAITNNAILQMIVFSVFFGVACASLGEKAKQVVDFAEQLSHVMLKVTGYVMKFAPIAVFAAIAKVVTINGLSIIATYGKFVGGFYLALALLWIVLIGAGFFVIGPRVLDLIRRMREPIALAFSTASSEAAYPRTLEELQKFGVSRRIGSFVLPLGYSFNLDGSMMYCTFATLFIAQIANVHLSIDQIITMLFLLMVTSKGMAAVPRASLVVIAGTLAHFNLPESGLALILAVDHFLDMGRSATNVVGNSIATAVVAKWEGEMDKEPQAPASSV